MRRMPSEKDVIELSERVKTLSDEVDKLKKFVKPYYCHRVHIISSEVPNTYFDIRLQLYSGDSERYSSFKDIAVKFGVVQLSCNGYITIEGTAYPVIFVSCKFVGPTTSQATIYYYDVNESGDSKLKSIGITETSQMVADEVVQI